MDNRGLVELYLGKILEVNERINLTRIDSWDRALILHIEDSLVGLEEIEQAPSGLYGDLGSGGGFPGVPVAIYTKRKTILVDSVKKKMNAVDSVVRDMGLQDQISVYGGRIEDLAKEYQGKFSVLTARALSRLNSLIELASPLLCIHGRLVCYKAQLDDEELDAALGICELVGMRMISRRSLMLSDEETHREIVVFEKVSKPKIKLPRKVGLAQNNPLDPK